MVDVLIAMTQLTFLVALIFVLWWLYRIAVRLDKILAEMARLSVVLKGIEASSERAAKQLEKIGKG